MGNPEVPTAQLRVTQGAPGRHPSKSRGAGKVCWLKIRLTFAKALGKKSWISSGAVSTLAGAGLDLGAGCVQQGTKLEFCRTGPLSYNFHGGVFFSSELGRKQVWKFCSSPTAQFYLLGLPGSWAYQEAAVVFLESKGEALAELEQGEG